MSIKNFQQTCAYFISSFCLEGLNLCKAGVGGKC